MSQKNSEKPAAWIMVVHDHPAVREALASRIGLQPDQEGTELAWKMSNPIMGYDGLLCMLGRSATSGTDWGSLSFKISILAQRPILMAKWVQQQRKRTNDQ